MFRISFLAIDPAWISPDQVFGPYIFNLGGIVSIPSFLECNFASHAE